MGSVDFNTDKGWYMYGLHSAYIGLKDFDNYHDAIKYIISLGGDTDTNACIAGAYYGFENMKTNEEFMSYSQM